MSNAWYPKYLQSLLSGDANTALTGSGSTGLWVALIDTNDVAYNAAHQFYSSIAAAVVSEIEVTTVTLTDGVVDGDNVVLPTVSGDISEALVFYRKNAGANTTWRLVAYVDTGGSGLPVTPNGGNINLNWNASGIIGL